MEKNTFYFVIFQDKDFCDILSTICRFGKKKQGRKERRKEARNEGSKEDRKEG
jgi:hypothetical protein